MYCRHEACKVRYRLVGFRTSRYYCRCLSAHWFSLSISKVYQLCILSSRVSVADLTCTCHLQFIVHCPRSLKSKARIAIFHSRDSGSAARKCAVRNASHSVGAHLRVTDFFLEDTVTAQSAKQTGFVNCQIVPWAISVSAALSGRAHLVPLVLSLTARTHNSTWALSPFSWMWARLV